MGFLVLLLGESLLLQLLRLLCLSQFALSAPHSPQLEKELFNFIYFDRILVIVVHQCLAERPAQVLIVLESGEIN